MRNAFRDALADRGARTANLVFLTGDLGFMALEPVREALGERFVNAGVAEQNMVGVAAGLARAGCEAWAYSIAPFIYARPFEHVRNDVCLHALPVRLVGNGGGYGYGPMGPTHHALEDYGTLSALPGMRCFVPAFDEDVAGAVEAIAAHAGPAYLRLGRGEPPKGWSVPAYAAWRRLRSGAGAVVLAVGPIAGQALAAATDFAGEDAPEIWSVCELPIVEGDPPEAFLSAIASRPLVVVEEHVAQGSAAQMLSLWLSTRGHGLARLRHVCARGYPSGLYGSQGYHRRESGLDAASLAAAFRTASEGPRHG